MRPSTAHQVSEDDVERVVKKIKLLGNGYDILYIGPKRFVQSVPCEFNTDHMEVLRIAEDTGYYTLSQLKTQLGWDDARIQTTMKLLLQEGMVWIDDQGGSEPLYWVPSYASLG
eukprot:TRINITY_DN7125_c0_g1_i2.p1 TRINITY_DN7125_c0_g1~~TRINITY_DN7125_c0_g1_i2.p1  ORF type:complete len:114 (-),score=16.82 TRINITY_DN7125_c0_g1_i2:251-592(-)